MLNQEFFFQISFNKKSSHMVLGRRDDDDDEVIPRSEQFTGSLQLYIPIYFKTIKDSFQVAI